MIDSSFDACFDLFPPGTDLPTRRATLTHPGAGSSVRAVAEALFNRDTLQVHRLLAADPDLARTRIGDGGDLMAIAVAVGSLEGIDLLLGYGAPAAGVNGAALELALVAHNLTIARHLLRAGAYVHFRDDPVGPFVAAIAANASDAVDLLFEFGADPNAMDDDGRGPLLTALYMETFRIAERLIDRGANPWAIDMTGGNLGTAATEQMQTSDVSEAEAQRRLAQRALAIGWPNPVPTPADIRHLAVIGKWPPAGRGAPPIAETVRRAIAIRARNVPS